MNENSNDTNEPDRGYRPSRRTMLAAAAWSVPVVVVAQAAPALASVSNPVFFTLTGACKLPGASNDFVKGYAFGLTLVNSLGANTVVYIESMKVGTTFRTIGLVEEWFTNNTCGTTQNVDQWGDPDPPRYLPDDAGRAHPRRQQRDSQPGRLHRRRRRQPVNDAGGLLLLHPERRNDSHLRGHLVRREPVERRVPAIHAGQGRGHVARPHLLAVLEVEPPRR